MLGQNVVNALPDVELSEKAVADLAEHERIDRAVVELTSDGYSSEQGYREGMVEAFWVEIDGQATVLQYEFGEWMVRGTFKPGDCKNEDEVHQTAFDLIDY